MTKRRAIARPGTHPKPTQMLPWQAADPKHREFDPMRVEEVYTARTFVDASETGRMTYMAAQASNGAIQFTWGRENRWSTNTAQGAGRTGCHALTHARSGTKNCLQ